MRLSCSRRMAALIAGNYEGRERKAAYAIIGGVAGAGIAIGPILGGWATTELSWRVVFVGEVVIVVGILAMSPFVHDASRDARKPRLDVVGAILSAAGLGAVVFGTLQASAWGWLKPKDSPVEPFGFSLTHLRDRSRLASCCGRSCAGSGTARRPAPTRSCTST